MMDKPFKIDPVLYLTGLTRAVGYYQTYRLNDKVNKFYATMENGQSTLKVSFHWKPTTETIIVTYETAKRYDQFEFVLNKPLIIRQFDLATMRERPLPLRRQIKRLEDFLAKIYGQHAMRQIRSDTMSYYYHNLKETK